MNDDSRRAQRDYALLGASYGVRSELNAFGNATERPLLQDLVGDVAGLRVLDAACAGGTFSEWLAQQGAAQVMALDVTAEMVVAARQRLSRTSTLVIQADLAVGVPLATASLDLVVSSFTLHYLRDWSTPLSEFRRVLRPNGALVISTHHPSSDVRLSPNADYFATTLLEDSWTGSDGRPVNVHFYRRPLREMSLALYNAGFFIERLEEHGPEGHPLYVFFRARLAAP